MKGRIKFHRCCAHILPVLMLVDLNKIDKNFIRNPEDLIKMAVPWKKNTIFTGFYLDHIKYIK